MTSRRLHFSPKKFTGLTFKEADEVFQRALVNEREFAQMLRNHREHYMNEEAAIEELIRAKNLTAPRVSPVQVDAAIACYEYHTFDNGTTVCLCLLKNGFSTTGTSSVVNKANFNLEIGQRIARENARNEVWKFLGFQLKDHLHRQALDRAEFVDHPGPFEYEQQI